MLNLVFVILFAGGLGWLAHQCKLPPLIGYLFAGFITGPHIPGFLELELNAFSSLFFLEPSDLDHAPAFRKAALMIILFRAGLQLKWNDLKEIGRPAFSLSIIPLACEVLAVYHLSMILFGFSATEASILSFCIAAVSPAVIVPSMLKLISSGEGMHKKVPVMILAGASLDDIIALAGFSAMLILAQDLNSTDSFISTPLALLTGLMGGYLVGKIFLILQNIIPQNIVKTTLSLAFCTGMLWLEQENLLPFSSVLGIMSFGFAVLKQSEDIAKALGSHMKWLWRPAELLLFLSIGAAASPDHLIYAGSMGVLIILLGLLARSAGVWLSLLKTNFNTREKLFCTLAYLPKATVQAAIGGIALQLVLNNELQFENGIKAAEMILALSVMSIAITAPLGAIAIQKTTSFLKPTKL